MFKNVNRRLLRIKHSVLRPIICKYVQVFTTFACWCSLDQPEMHKICPPCGKTITRNVVFSFQEQNQSCQIWQIPGAELMSTDWLMVSSWRTRDNWSLGLLLPCYSRILQNQVLTGQVYTRNLTSEAQMLTALLLKLCGRQIVVHSKWSLILQVYPWTPLSTLPTKSSVVNVYLLMVGHLLVVIMSVLTSSGSWKVIRCQKGNGVDLLRKPRERFSLLYTYIHLKETTYSNTYIKLKALYWQFGGVAWTANLPINEKFFLNPKACLRGSSLCFSWFPVSSGLHYIEGWFVSNLIKSSQQELSLQTCFRLM